MENNLQSPPLFKSTHNLTIYNDDALKIVKRMIKEKVVVDHIITDPPYLISKKNNLQTMKGNITGVDFGSWDKNFDLYGWIDQYSKIINTGGSFVVFCSYRYISYIIYRLEINGFVVKDVIKWIKSNPMPRNVERRYVQDTEFAIWAVKSGSKWTFNKSGNAYYDRAEIRTSVVSGLEKVGHPTQKSIHLMKKIIETHTNAGDTVLDPFMGSGTTGVACGILNRKFIGIEMDKKYYGMADKRIFNNNYQTKPAV